MLLHGKAGAARIIQFTASHHCEGTTSIALAFASYLSVVHDPEGIILVEANFRRPSFGSVLCMKEGRTLRDVVNGVASMEEAVRRPEETNLRVVVAGEEHETSRTQSHERVFDLMVPLFEGLKSRFSVVILDTPPVVPYVDAAIISGMADSVALVVESNLTRSHVVNHALDKLKASGGKMAGLILNKREFFIPKWLYRFL